jgi:carboxymethylenebutenolidase
VVVLHEAFGLNDDIRRIAHRFAENGYVALAPDLYSHGSRARCLTRVMLDTYRGAGEGTLGDIEATRAALAERLEVDAERIAVVGFCQGGGFALAFAGRGGVQAVAPNYGAVPRAQGSLDQICPVVASYGGRDRFVGAKEAAKLERYLTELGVPHDVKVYENVGHSFMGQADTWMARLPSPLHPGYSEPEAEDAWRRILDFFGEHLAKQ